MVRVNEITDVESPIEATLEIIEAPAKGESTDQPTAHLTDKTNGTVYGAAITTFIVGLCLQFGVEINPMLSSGVSGLAAIIGSYMMKERRH